MSDKVQDIEAQEGGANIARSISVSLTHEQFERLYLQPGGVAAKGDLAKRLANPTPLGVASFLLCLTPFSCELMGWGGSTTAAAVVTVGAFYFVGGLGLFVAGLLEFIIGNTFPSVVFCTFGAFWFSFGWVLNPTNDVVVATAGADTPAYNFGLALYLIWWSVLVIIYFIASLRTNVVFVLLFLFLDIAFWILSGMYIRLANGNTDNLDVLMKAAGAFAFLTTLCGWYLECVLIFGSTGIPIALPVGDLSGFMDKKKA